MLSLFPSLVWQLPMEAEIWQSHVARPYCQLLYARHSNDLNNSAEVKDQMRLH